MFFQKSITEKDKNICLFVIEEKVKKNKEWIAIGFAHRPTFCNRTFINWFGGLHRWSINEDNYNWCDLNGDSLSIVGCGILLTGIKVMRHN